MGFGIWVLVIPQRVNGLLEFASDFHSPVAAPCKRRRQSLQVVGLGDYRLGKGSQCGGPEGRLIIAQRFIAGIRPPHSNRVPEGRLTRLANRGAGQPGLEPSQSSLRDYVISCHRTPSDKSLGYFRMALQVRFNNGLPGNSQVRQPAQTAATNPLFPLFSPVKKICQPQPSRYHFRHEDNPLSPH